ncbi:MULTISPECIES: AAA family ATPase [unclassified Paenibacillus]|uniref:AAA family ATPase n=1 Tax=unclassified Paenibacillus TaxID=185978 RepID=UPI00277F7FBD|nr:MULTISPECIES: AAA family ATPase [unclassified Paenibacillus]MDQ0896264.1 SpoVK/Ycf46/Vps4 family AAA+-type ATPase [Paenibacillus sp. V4I7]MDQ0913808.1 SpoVK/Ycf46/Vps4 family AAA+-type ATPase [Paenibacillus sp. V4I5]
MGMMIRNFADAQSAVEKLLEEENADSCYLLSDEIVSGRLQYLEELINRSVHLQNIDNLESYDWQTLEEYYLRTESICSPKDIFSLFDELAHLELEEPSVKNRSIYQAVFNMSKIQYFRALAAVDNDPELLRCFGRLMNAADYFIDLNGSNDEFISIATSIVNELPSIKWMALSELMRVYRDDLLAMVNGEHKYYSYTDTEYGVFQHAIVSRFSIQIEDIVFPNRSKETIELPSDKLNLNKNGQISNSVPEDPVVIFEKMDRIIGLKTVKDFIRSLYSFLTVQKKRKELGLATQSTQTVHMIFKGNPGTGKTTFARIVAEVLHSVGYLPQVKLTEMDRSKLVAGYVGQTAIQTREAVQSALDGVLFIDEAYSLASDADSKNGFGKEAIDTLVKEIDDNRDRIVVILAGYSKEMDDFLQTNPGLKSRFPNVIDFPDYNTDELLEIASRMYTESDYQLTEVAISKMRAIFDEVRHDSQFGNGRYVRNLYEKSLRLQSHRLVNETDFSRETFMMIDGNDIEKV